MSQVLVRNLPEKTVAQLKARAKRNRRSLQAELRLVLEAAARPVPANWRKELERLDRLFTGRTVRDSTDLIRADRESH